MPQRPVYLLSPHADFFPGIDDWVQEAVVLFCQEAPRWNVEHQSYDKQNSFGVHQLSVKARNKPGPIVLVSPVNSKAVYTLRAKLMTSTVILDNVRATCVEDIWGALTEARRLTEDGYPLLPRKFVVAVLIIRKLMRQKQWGGKKGFLKASDLPEGGIPPILKGLVLPVANDLRLHGLLVHKTSQGKAKYGLSDKDMMAIHTAANGDFSNYPALKRMLERDQELVSKVWLEEDIFVEKFTITSPTGEGIDFLKVEEAISALEVGTEGEYQVCVHFNTHRQLWDSFHQKGDLLDFLHGFSP